MTAMFIKRYTCIIITVVFLVCADGLAEKVSSQAPERNALSNNDDVAMVLVPGGIYTMGSVDGDPDEKPVHEVYVDRFYIDVQEVTIRQYKKFMDATGHTKPDFWQPELDRSNDPVAGVSWKDAGAYASWAGKRLPTEAEWEYAARGGKIQGKYPWGDTPDTSYANFNSFGITPVRSFKPNGFGIYDMVGNVWEWCSDWYDPEYYNASSMKNPAGPVSGVYKVIRGGAWYCDKDEVRVANRFFALPEATSYNTGFRCVLSAQ